MQPLVSPAVLQKLQNDASVPDQLMDLNFCCCLGSFCNKDWETTDDTNVSKDKSNEIVMTQKLEQSDWTFNEIVFISMLMILTTTILSLLILVIMNTRNKKHKTHFKKPLQLDTLQSEKDWQSSTYRS